MNSTSPSAPALLQTILTASQNGVIVYQPVRDAMGVLSDLRLTMLNDIAEQDINRPATELIGQLFSQLFPQPDEITLLEQYREVFTTGKAARFEFQSTPPHQQAPTWFEVAAVRVDDNLVVSYTDISRAKADAEAAQRAEVLKRAFDASISGITVYEAVRNQEGQIDDFRFAMINDAGLRMSGYTREKLIGKSVWQIYPATKINGLFDQYVQVCETGQPYSGEHYYPEYDIWREITIVPVVDGIMLTYFDITARKKLEITAFQQAQLLQNVLEGVPVGTAVLSPVRNRTGGENRITDFLVVRVNMSLRRILALSVSDCVGQLLTTVFKKASESGLLSRCIIGLELGEPQEYDMPYATNGSPLWYRVSIVCLGDQVILTLTDITSTKVAQLEHHFQAELLQKISDNTPAGLVLWEAVRDTTDQQTVVDFCYRMSNLMNTVVTGYAEKDLVGKNLLETFPRFRGTELEATLREVVETGCTQRMIFTYYTERPGTWFDAQFVRKRDGVLMTFMDVTEQHKAQLAQKAQAHLFQTVINIQPAGMVLFSPVREPTADREPKRIVDFVYEMVNETELRLLGMSTNELTGQRFRTLFPSDDGQQLFEKMVAVAETGESQEWLLPFFSDGIQGWFKASLIRHGDQILFTFLDVTELKRQQQALEVVNMELRHSNDNLQQFAYIASHDLQEPLRKIQSFGDIIASRNAHELDDNAKDMLARMQAAASRMSTLIKDLLDYSRITTHRTPFAPVVLPDLLNEVLNDLSVAVQESKATIIWDKLPVVFGDKKQLAQLFQNLLSNAIKFRREAEAPQIQVSARTVSIKDMPPSLIEKSLIILTKVDGTDLVFHEINVTDNGIGFDEQYLDRIFQVFQRLHGKAKYPGTGVGLAICRKVIENHRGILTATSEAYKGATFTVYLPVGENVKQGWLTD